MGFNLLDRTLFGMLISSGPRQFQSAQQDLVWYVDKFRTSSSGFKSAQQDLVWYVDKFRT